MKSAYSLRRACVRCLAAALLTVLLVALSGSGFTGDTRAQSFESRDHAKKELAAIQDEWCKARVTGDVHFLERLYADNVTIAVSDGRVIGRTEDLAEFAAKKSRPESVVDEGLKIKLYGDTAVVTGLERLQGHAGGNTVEVLLRVLNVFVKMNGEWRLVARQGTTLNSSPGGHS